jgi:uncharacterized protein YidB (DUF937 family)
MYFGLVSGVIGGVTGMDSFLKYFGLYGDSDATTNVTGNIVSILQAGGCGGALTANIAAGNNQSITDIHYYILTQIYKHELYL